MSALVPGLLALGVVVIALKSFKIIGQAEVIVVERLGRFHRVARSGLNILIPFVERPEIPRRAFLRDRCHRSPANQRRIDAADRSA